MSTLTAQRSLACAYPITNRITYRAGNEFMSTMNTGQEISAHVNKLRKEGGHSETFLSEYQGFLTRLSGLGDLTYTVKGLPVTFSFGDKAREIPLDFLKYRDNRKSDGSLALGEGASIMERLTALANRAQPSPGGPLEQGKAAILREIITELRHPFTTTQDRHGTCAAEAISIQLMMRNPAEWTRIAIDLLVNPKGTPIPTSQKDPKGNDVVLKLPDDIWDLDNSPQRSPVAAAIQSAIKNSFAPDGWTYSNSADNYTDRDGKTHSSGMGIKEAKSALEALLGCEHLLRANPDPDDRKSKWSEWFKKAAGHGVYTVLKWTSLPKGRHELHAINVIGYDKNEDRITFRNPHRQQDETKGNDIIDDGPARRSEDEETGLESMSLSHFMTRVRYAIPSKEAIDSIEAGKDPLQNENTTKFPPTPEDAVAAFDAQTGKAHTRSAITSSTEISTLLKNSPGGIPVVLRWGTQTSYQGYNIVQIISCKLDPGTGEATVVFRNPKPDSTNDSKEVVKAEDIIRRSGPERTVVNPAEGTERMPLAYFIGHHPEVLADRPLSATEPTRRLALKKLLFGGVAAAAGIGVVGVGVPYALNNREGSRALEDPEVGSGSLSLDEAKRLLDHNLIAGPQLRKLDLIENDGLASLPPVITGTLLRARCPVSRSGSEIKDTHTLVLLPKELSFNDIIKFCKTNDILVEDRRGLTSLSWASRRPEQSSWSMVCAVAPPREPFSRQFTSRSSAGKQVVLVSNYPEYTQASARAVLISAITKLLGHEASGSPGVKSRVLETATKSEDGEFICLGIDLGTPKKITIGLRSDFDSFELDLAIARKLNP